DPCRGRRGCQILLDRAENLAVGPLSPAALGCEQGRSPADEVHRDRGVESQSELDQAEKQEKENGKREGKFDERLPALRRGGLPPAPDHDRQTMADRAARHTRTSG